jgi:2-succinyl-5-enolpyruvyl-6-hydroxy-3-cyclohexene-1-carboxylate synthase
LAEHALSEVFLGEGPTLTGPVVARVLGEVLGTPPVVGERFPVVADTAGAPLLLAAASWSVRHLEAFARYEGGCNPLVIGNRGVNGIDGLVSTVWGAALAAHQQTPGAYALLGDLAFLHDHNGLLAPALERRPDLTLVVVDNNGGGIFSSLEQGRPEFAGHFERIFGTPPDVSVADIARAAGLPVFEAHDVDGLRRALREPWSGVRVLLAHCADRAYEQALLERLKRAVRESLSTALSEDP